MRIHTEVGDRGFLVNIGVLILTSLWRPLAGQPSQLLLYTATWGIVDGTLQSQVQAVVGRYAREERDTAMTIFRVMQGVGLMTSFIISLTTRTLMTLLYVALPLHVLGFLGLILTTNEITQRERTTQERESSPQYSPPSSPSPSPSHGSGDGGGGGGGGGQENPAVQGEYCDISGEV
ncbi:hypothetical protein ACOMHN_060708 [Nucella lapillus]